MKFTDKKLLIFDLDGTLIDSAADLALALNLMLEELNMPTYSEETIREWIGNGAQTLVKRGLCGQKEITDIDEALFDKALVLFLDLYTQNLCVKTTMYPHVKNTLESLVERGYDLTLATNKPIGFVEPILKYFELNGLFSYALGGDSLSVKKPRPEPLLHICEHKKVAPEQSVMIGDSKNDILAAQGANMDVIAVNYGYQQNEDLSSFTPQHTIEGFDELLHALEGNVS